MKTTENGQAKTNGYATRDQLLAPGKRRFKDVELPISGLRVKIRSLMEVELEKFLSEAMSRGQLNKEKTVSSYRRMIVLCVVDHDGSPLFSSADLDALNQWDGADINHLGKECEAHCGLVQGEAERTEKN